MDLNEKTPAPRVQLTLPISFRKVYGRRDENGTLKNISLSGAFLKTHNETYYPKDKLIFTMQVSGRTRKINVEIIWKNKNGYGIQFLPFNQTDVQLIDDLIYFVNVKRESKKSLLGSIFDKVS